MNLMIIPDAHAHPDYNNERFRAVGRLLMEEQPECVVCLGDLADLPSLSSYDRGTKGFEGRRYKMQYFLLDILLTNRVLAD